MRLAEQTLHRILAIPNEIMTHLLRTSTGQRENELNFANELDSVRGTKDGTSKQQLISKLADQLSPLITTTDNQNKTRTETTNTSLQSTDETLLMDCSSGDASVLLPDASTVYDATNDIGQQFYIKKIDTTTNKLQINSTGGQLIDGDSSGQIEMFGPDQLGILIQSIGSAWSIIIP